MLSRFSDVLQATADVLAPPATRYEDFQYHWKTIINFYQNYDDNSKVHIEDTRVPHHLHQMLQLIVDEEKEEQDGTVGPCLESVIQRSIPVLDALAVLAVADRPPGARAMALTLATALLRRTKRPCINSAHVYRPIQRMLVQCNESPASPTEKEEVELLLTLCGLVRKEPGLANIFTTPFVEDKSTLLSIPDDIKKLIPIKRKTHTPKKNPLFEVDMAPIPMRNVSIVRNNKDDCTSNASVISGPEDNGSCKSQKTVYDDNDKFLLIDLLLSYLNSADNQVVLRACEGIMIVSSLPEDDIANLVTSSPACEVIVDKLLARYRSIPYNLDPNDVDHLNITWAYVAQDFGDKTYNRFIGYRELTSFFSWLDYCDTLMKECHPTIACHLARIFRAQFLEGAAEALLATDSTESLLPATESLLPAAESLLPATELRVSATETLLPATESRVSATESLLPTVARVSAKRAALTAAVLAKCLRVVDSPDLINEFSNWLVGDGEVCEWPLLRALIDNCLTTNHDLTLETLRFFEAVIEKGTEHSMDRLVLARVSSRGYCAVGPAPRAPSPLQEERDRLNDVSYGRERERNREAMRQLQHEEHVSEQVGDILHHEGLDRQDSGDNIHRVINSFLLLLPRAILSDPVGTDYENYIHDAQKHYQLWLDVTSTYNWPTEVTYIDNTASSTHSYDSRPEVDLHMDDVFDNRIEIDSYRKIDYSFVNRSSLGEDEFDEGPFFRMLFKLLGNMPDQPYQVNLHLTSIISKLALLPHPNLHEYLLNPNLQTAKKTQTLFKVLQDVARRLTMEIPRLKNYKKIIENTRLELMSEDPSYDERNDHNQLVESLIVLEEFCKELAAIAFVKYQHVMHMHR